ncbi:MAG: hypothetical protein H8E44_45975 [Planctomycetes bacterium]|nr:hypothetical protein [Planctomycetota bacterium]
MVLMLKLFGSVLLLAVAGFCAFGFLATFEPLPPAEQWTWRGIYIVIGLACLAGAVRLGWRRNTA